MAKFMSSGFLFRLRNRVREANLNSESFNADPADQAGRAAERRVCLDLSRRLTGTGWEFRDNVRVPDPTQRRQRELDFVITSPEEVIIVELKNWSGRIAFGNDEAVIQHRRFEKGEENHGALFADLQERVDVLGLHHCSKGRRPVAIRGYVVFFNDKLEVSEEIAQRADVLTYVKLLSFMPPLEEEPSILRRILLAIMKFFGAKQAMKNKPEPAVPTTGIIGFRETLAELGSWDIVDLYGGGYVIGDIQAPIATSNVEPSDVLDRKLVHSLEMDVDRSMLRAVFFEPEACANITKWDGTSQVRRINSSLRIRIRPAGEKEVKEYQARNVVRLSFGYKRRPSFTYAYEELCEGMLMVGKVRGTKDFGVFVDIGLRGADGQPRDVLAPSHGRQTARRVPPLGARVLVRVEKLVKATGRVFVEILEPQVA
jgi:hypothetical protein